MNFQQLRYVRAAIQNSLNLTKVAAELFTSQSGVSKQIKELESELKIEIFVRRGKRLVGLTPAGESAAKLIDQVLQAGDNLKRLSEQFAHANKGRLIIAATHNQATYVLPAVLVRFSKLFPDVEVELRQGSPTYVVDMLVRGEADIGVATEAVDGNPHLDTFTCFTWDHVAVVPPGHPLLSLAEPALDDIARHPVVTYSPQFSGGAQIQEAFQAAGLDPDVRLTAMDADVIKTYVRLGIGVGIISQMAIENGAGSSLFAVPGSNRFFKPCSTKIAVAKGTLLRNYTYQLIEMLAPHLDAAVLSGARKPRPGAPAAAALCFDDRPDLRFGHSPDDAVNDLWRSPVIA